MRRFFLTAALACLLAPGVASAETTLPPGFQESVAITGLVQPMVVRFSPDGRVFVAEKSGLIKVFDNLDDSTASIYADLRTQVYDYWDRGLLGMALAPTFPADPSIYVLYTRDAVIGGAAPRWNDACPSPPGPNTDGCVASGRLSRLNAAGNETALINDWCQQFPSHSLGQIQFGPDGALYASAGDGAGFHATDFGQFGNPKNPAGTRPVASVATRSRPPRRAAASAPRTSGRPATQSGWTGRSSASTRPPARRSRRTHCSETPMPTRGASSSTASATPSARPSGPERASSGSATSASASSTRSTGSPTSWGRSRTAAGRASRARCPPPAWERLDMTLCLPLPATHAPYYSYAHADKVVPGETCPSGSTSLSGLAFYRGGPYPAAYDGALFFADYSRDCIWAMRAGGNGLPNPSDVITFVAPATNPVALEIGPGGDLFYVDFGGDPVVGGGKTPGTIRRISHFAGNQPPVARIDASATSGLAPLTVQFDGRDSSDPEGATLTYAWDLDGDGALDDSTSATPQRTYTAAGNVTVRLRVTDPAGLSDDVTVLISVGNTAPVATITAPTAAVTWSVGQALPFAGTGTDVQDGPLPASAFSWELRMHHCPSNCHTHPVEVAHRRQERRLRRARPRVPVPPGAAPDRDRLQRPAGHAPASCSSRGRST